jgi:hypothetical protein
VIVEKTKQPEGKQERQRKGMIGRGVNDVMA